MHGSRTSVGKMRRFVAIASAAVALLAIVAEPALAAYGYMNLQRPFTIGTRRTHLAQVFRVTDSAPGMHAGTHIVFGALEGGSTLGLTLNQAGTRLASRALDGDGWGQFKNVSSPNNICTFEAMTEDGFGMLNCEDNTVDWLGNTPYRFNVIRGDRMNPPVARNTNGFYWNVSLSRYNKTTKKWASRKILSFRLPQGQLGAEQQGPYLFANANDCDAVDRVSATFSQPVSSGSTTTWKPSTKYRYGCSEAQASMTASGTSTGPVTFTVAP